MNDDKLLRDALIGTALLAALVLAALFLGIISGLRWYLSPDNDLSIIQRRDLVQGLASAGQALAVFLTGAVGLIGLFFTWQNTSQARQSTQRTLELTEQGQITERFTKAIEQLGAISDNGNKILEVRLGGIHALARIAKESEKDYRSIIHILTAYVRHHAPRRSPDDPDIDAFLDALPGTFPSGDDVQAILHFIGERTQHDEGSRVFVNLEHTDLRGAECTGLNFRRVWFWEADLTRAFFGGADLANGHLQAANLRDTIFWDANLEGVDFTEADLREAEFSRADLAAAGLSEANLAGADLSEAHNLTQEQINEAHGNEHTILPEGLHPPKNWSENSED